MENNKITIFVSENMKTIYAYALNRLSNYTDAEELTSDIILALLSSGDKLKDDDAIYGFVWAIANNTYKKFLSKRKKYNYVEMDETMVYSDDDIGDLVVQEEDIRKLRRELSLLSNEHRVCTVALYFQHMGCREIAESHQLSLEMVKYYLFKSRKILREGIDMEREYGEKSFNPATFDFRVIFEKKANSEYVKLFNRKICGNILVSAYYAAVSVKELSLELGISAAYIEDELDLLERHRLVIKDSRNKYQTNIIIFTENYREELIEKTKHKLKLGAHNIYNSLVKKLNCIRKINFYGNDFTDNQLLWLAALILLYHYPEKHGKLPYQELVAGYTGAAFGYDYSGSLHEKYLDEYAGFSQISDDLYATFINLHALGDMKYKYNEKKEERLKKIYDHTADFPIIKREEKIALLELLSNELKMTADLYNMLADTAGKLLMEHSPSSIASKAHTYVHLDLESAFLGMLPDMMLQERLLFIPKDSHVGMYVNSDRQGVIEFHHALNGGGNIGI